MTQPSLPPPSASATETATAVASAIPARIASTLTTIRFIVVPPHATLSAAPAYYRFPYASAWMESDIRRYLCEQRARLARLGRAQRGENLGRLQPVPGGQVGHRLLRAPQQQ